MPAAETVKEVTFDENGRTVGETALEAIAPIDEVVEDTQEEAGTAEGKYKIGDRTFNTEAEALTFAQSHISTIETEAQVADAYRQGIRDAQASVNPNVIVTPQAPPPPPVINEQDFYENPTEFLKKFESRVKTEAIAEIQSRQQRDQQGTQIWNEFASRHPDLADFRTEVEDLALKHQTELRAINGTKGQTAAFDFVALKLKSQFTRYADAVKPRKQLPNTGGNVTPSGQGTSVTTQKSATKTLSFSEQLASIRRKRK